MKALTFQRYGETPDIALAEVPRPTLQPDEMLVQVHAASVNPIDNMIPTGTSRPSCACGCPPRWAATWPAW